MEVLVEGFLPEERVLEGKCSYCGCRIRGKQGEWREAHYSDFRESYTNYYAPCPTPNCGKTIAGSPTPPSFR